METSAILKAAVGVGQAILTNGGEIYRVETTIRMILEAYRIPPEDIDVFAITNMLLVTITEDGHPMTKSVRISARTTDLDKVEALNSLSRYICQNTPPGSEILQRLKEIREGRVYSLWLQTVSYAAGAFFFCMFFHGSFSDAVAAGLIGAIIRIAQWLLDRSRANALFSLLLCSALTAALSVLSLRTGLTQNMDKIIIGALMTLVPGMLLTSCMRDFISGDIVAGLSRLAEAILIAACIAAGTVITLFLLR